MEKRAVKRNICLLYAMSFLQGMVFYGAISTLYRAAFDVTVFQIMLIESVSLVLGLVLEVPWGVAADKMGYRRTMILCSALYALSKVIFWQARGFGWFLAERVLLSVVTAGLSGVDASILYLSCEEGQSQKVFGIFDALGTAGMMFATLIYAAFVGENYRLAAFLTVITYTAAAILPFFLGEVKEQTQRASSWKDTAGAIVRTLRDPLLMVFLVAAGLVCEMQWAVTVFLNQLQYERCGMSLSLIGYVYILATAAELCSALSDGVTKRLGMGRALLLLTAVSAAACGLLAVTEDPWLSVGCVLLLVLAASLVGPLLSELKNRQVTTANRATMLSIFAIVTNAVGVTADLVFGALADRDLPTAFLFGAGIGAVSVLLFALWQKKNGRLPAEEKG